MLNIDEEIVFEPTVTIRLKARMTTFGIKCRLLDIDVLTALRKQWMGEPATEAAPAVPPIMDDRQFIDAWLVGFADDVMDAGGNPLPFEPANVTRLLARAGAKKAILDAFFSGYEEAETKNSETPRAG